MNFFKNWIMPIIFALLIVTFLNMFIFVLVTVPTPSMVSAIRPGDRLYVSKLINKDDIKRGDILVFDSDELNKKLVKRVIGLPNDVLKFNENGEVFINDELLDEPYAIKSGVSERAFKVPANCYFFVGDNRPSSDDARFWDNPYIPKDKIIGKAIFRFFPLNRIGVIK